MVGVVLAHAHDLASRDDRRQQAYVLESEALTGGLEALVQRITGHGSDEAPRLRGLLVLHDAELWLLAHGEPRDAHGGEPTGGAPP